MSDRTVSSYTGLVNQEAPLNTRALTSIGPVERRSVYDEVVARLGEFIVNSNLKPGDKLPAERELMEALHVGRSSLREAVKSLRAVGAIEVVAGGGMYVGRGGTQALSRPLSWAVFLNATSTLQAMEARQELEASLAALAAERATVDELDELRDCIGRMKDAQHDEEAYLQADIHFHMTIARAAKNDILYYAIDMLQNVVRAWIRRILRRANGEPVSLQEHVAVFDAIEAHDTAGARAAMTAHIRAACRRLLAASPEIAQQ